MDRADGRDQGQRAARFVTKEQPRPFDRPRQAPSAGRGSVEAEPAIIAVVADQQDRVQPGGIGDGKRRGDQAATETEVARRWRDGDRAEQCQRCPAILGDDQDRPILNAPEQPLAIAGDEAEAVDRCRACPQQRGGAPMPLPTEDGIEQRFDRRAVSPSRGSKMNIAQRPSAALSAGATSGSQIAGSSSVAWPLVLADAGTLIRVKPAGSGGASAAG